jgi:polar amino acid transport system substrate-binding protein
VATMPEFAFSRRTTLKLLGGTALAGAVAALAGPARAEPVTIKKVKEMGKLRIGVEATYPPFTFRDAGKIVGYDIDLADIFCERLGVKPEVIDTQWSGVIPSLYAGRFEIIMSSMSYTKERLERVLFTIPYAEASQALLIRLADKDKIKSIEDMSGRMLGIKLGSPGEVMRPQLDDKIKAAKGAGFKGHKTYDDHPAAYLALGQGTVDGVLNTLPTLAQVLKDRPGHYAIVRGVAHKNWAGISMRKEDVEIKKFLDDEIVRLKQSGKLWELQDKWFGLRMDLADNIPQL